MHCGVEKAPLTSFSGKDERERAATIVASLRARIAFSSTRVPCDWSTGENEMHLLLKEGVHTRSHRGDVNDDAVIY